MPPFLLNDKERVKGKKLLRSSDNVIGLSKLFVPPAH